MSLNWQRLSILLTEQLGQQFEIKKADSVSGGDIHSAFQLDNNLGRFFLKTNHLASAPLFATEANALQKLKTLSDFKVPKVISLGTTAEHAWLLLEHLEMTAHGDDFHRGQILAKMHQIDEHNTPQPFGWFETNYIGHTTQNNPWNEDWVTFFGENRLRYQLNLIESTNGPSTLIDTGHQLIEKLPCFFEDYQPAASLLHGDLWGGNSAFLTSGEATIFDPASYYGDRETDLAMSELFGGFSKEFYKGYDAVYPLDKGYKTRKDLYNLYHLLNHFTLFGGAYGIQTERAIQRLLKLC